MSFLRAERTWEVRFLGDPEYGRDEWDRAANGDTTHIVAEDASTAARRALSRWRAADPFGTKEEGFYGPGTIIGVREVIEPPPVKTFIVENGRPKLERVKS